MKKELKHVTCSRDYVLYQLLAGLRNQVFTITSYFQDKSKYDEAYQKAFDLYKTISKDTDKWEDALAQLNYKGE